MMLKYHLFFIGLCRFINRTTQTIAGITYMDNYDFEERYRNIYECNPFYWHPLHMPEHCTRIFEKLIRKGVAKYGPLRIVKKKNNRYSSSQDYQEFDYSKEDDTMAPYERMLELLKNDVIREPSAPTIAYFPGLGAAALYNQAVSKQSGDYIKKVAEDYREFSFGFAPVYRPTDAPEQDSDEVKEINKKDIDSIKKEIDSKLKELDSENKEKPKYNIRKKYHKGDLITVLRTNHY